MRYGLIYLTPRYREHMASGIVSYYPLSISTIRIADIASCNYRYRQFQLSISAIRISDISNEHDLLISTNRIADINNWYCCDCAFVISTIGIVQDQDRDPPRFSETETFKKQVSRPRLHPCYGQYGLWSISSGIADISNSNSRYRQLVLNDDSACLAIVI